MSSTSLDIDDVAVAKVMRQRRAPGETVEPYRRRINGPEGNLLRDHLAQWAATLDLSTSFPDLPPVWRTVTRTAGNR